MQADVVRLQSEAINRLPGIGEADPMRVGQRRERPVIVAAAIANAVEDAIGVRTKGLPITAEKVHAAIKSARGHMRCEECNRYRAEAQEL